TFPDNRLHLFYHQPPPNRETATSHRLKILDSGSKSPPASTLDQPKVLQRRYVPTFSSLDVDIVPVRNNCSSQGLGRRIGLQKQLGTVIRFGKFDIWH
ncbi:hypothetical protein WG66_000966, partial [Moniliophthora roreri]